MIPMKRLVILINILLAFMSLISHAKENSKLVKQYETDETTKKILAETTILNYERQKYTVTYSKKNGLLKISDSNGEELYSLSGARVEDSLTTPKKMFLIIYKQVEASFEAWNFYNVLCIYESDKTLEITPLFGGEKSFDGAFSLNKDFRLSHAISFVKISENENNLTFVGAIYNIKTNFPGKLYEYWSIDYDLSQLGKGPLPQK